MPSSSSSSCSSRQQEAVLASSSGMPRRDVLWWREEEVWLWATTGLCLTVAITCVARVLMLLIEVEPAPGVWWAFSLFTFFCLTERAMRTHMLWRLEATGPAWCSRSYWYLLWQASLLYLIHMIQFANGFLCRSTAPLVVRALFILGVNMLWSWSLYSLLSHAEVQLFPRKLLKRRRGWQWNLGAGLVVAVPMYIALEGLRASWEDPGVGWLTISLASVVLLWFVSSMLLRNAAMQGQALTLVLMGVTVLVRTGGNEGWLSAIISNLLHGVAFILAGTAETASDARATAHLIWASTFALLGGEVVSAEVAQPWLRLLLVGQFLIYFGHFANICLVRGRGMEDWADSVAFLKLGKIRRRCAADSGFVLARRQDMDSAFFGNPTRAKYIVVVSHAWLSPKHADPDGLHLGLVISRLEARYMSKHSSVLWKRWWNYYYWQSEGDVLVFFDMACLYQSPRTPQEEEAFQQSLKRMNFLYFAFDVLVIPEIPEDVLHHGHYLSYQEKGWCWAEAAIASLGGRLHRLSPDAPGVLQGRESQTLRRQNCMSLSDALLGMPLYPDHLRLRGKEHELMEYRRGQTIQGKVFTNGKFDSDRVARILLALERKQKLRWCLLAGDTEEVRKIFEDEDFFTESISGLAKEDLANTFFDGSFTTPLHIAVDAGHVEIVEFLVSVGAIPRRSFSGRLPWERFTHVPIFTEAAVAARIALRAAACRRIGRGYSTATTAALPSF